MNNIQGIHRVHFFHSAIHNTIKNQMDGFRSHIVFEYIKKNFTCRQKIQRLHNALLQTELFCTLRNRRKCIVFFN